MKKLIVMSVMSLIATSAIAASPEVLKAVLSSKEIGNVQNIDKVEVVATYKCPNCYDIAITGTNMFGEAYVKVQTEQTIGGPLTIKYVEGSK